MRKILLSLLVLPLLSSLAFGQAAVQQTATKLDAATAVAVSTNYNTVNTQAVATITVPSGQFAYITRIELEAMQNATSTVATNVNFTSTGLGSGATASPQWGITVPATANASIYRDANFSTPLKSAASGTNVTVTSPTALTNLAFGIKVYYYLAN